jgi:hypothetical protein
MINYLNIPTLNEKLNDFKKLCYSEMPKLFIGQPEKFRKKIFYDEDYREFIREIIPNNIAKMIPTIYSTEEEKLVIEAEEAERKQKREKEQQREQREQREKLEQREKREREKQQYENWFQRGQDQRRKQEKFQQERDQKHKKEWDRQQREREEKERFRNEKRQREERRKSQQWQQQWQQQERRRKQQQQQREERRRNQQPRLRKPFIVEQCDTITFFEEICDENKQNMKKNYKKFVLKYHPDKIARLPEAEQKKSVEKFKTGSVCYNKLKETNIREGECERALEYLKSQNS